MPIPKPNDGEKQDEFIGRCMSAIGGEYPQDQAAAICHAQWKEKREARTANAEILRLHAGHPRDWDESTLAHLESVISGMSGQDVQDTWEAIGGAGRTTKDKLYRRFRDRWGSWIDTGYRAAPTFGERYGQS